MKKILFISLTLAMIFSCNRNLLDATKIPNSIDLSNVDGFEYKHIDINPQTTPEGIVFGGYEYRFKFKNDWYVLTGSMYKYDNVKKALAHIGSNVILRVDNEDKLTIYAKNLPEDDSVLWPEVGHNWHDKYNNNAIYNLTRIRTSLVVKDDMIYNEFNWTHNYKYKVNYSKRTVDSGDLGKYGVDEIEAYWPSSMTVERNGRGKTYTTDLVNWTTEYRYGETWTPVRFPSPTFNFNEDGYPPNNNFNGRAGVIWPAIVNFKGYTYVLGGYDTGRDEIDKWNKKTYNLALKYYYRLADGKDGSVAGNWEYRSVPFGRRASMLVRINEEEGKMYINDGVSATMTVDPFAFKNDDKVSYSFPRDFRNNVWSTTDGITWVCDTVENWDNASYIDYENGSKYIGPDPGPAFPKTGVSPQGMSFPSYAELNGLYYRIDKGHIYDPEKNGLPDKVSEALYDRSETNYVVTEQDIIDAGVSKLLVSSVHPDIARDSDWKILPPYSPMTSAVWMDGDKMLFNINGKLVRLVNYNTVQGKVEEYSRMANYYADDHKMWYERALAGGYTNGMHTIKEHYCYYMSMNSQAKSSIYTYYATNMIKHYMPEKAITHYSIDLSRAD